VRRLVVAAAMLASAAAQAQQVTELDARSYVLSAFITGAAPAILSQNVGLSPELRARLQLPANASRDAIYAALIRLTESEEPKTIASAYQLPDGATRSPDRPVLALDAGDVHLLVQYDLKANNVSFVGVPPGRK
jgi:hypothetical protein